mmetsp:Transcript_33769/g.106193  ORF Transcript_33769/g.106193 Transcript_33769/m.106193 type:complete len:203 (-) Transcript_33769:837-1445(-)
MVVVISSVRTATPAATATTASVRTGVCMRGPRSFSWTALEASSIFAASASSTPIRSFRVRETSMRRLAVASSAFSAAAPTRAVFCKKARAAVTRQIASLMPSHPRSHFSNVARASAMTGCNAAGGGRGGTQPLARLPPFAKAVEGSSKASVLLILFAERMILSSSAQHARKRASESALRSSGSSCARMSAPVRLEANPRMSW